MSGLEGDVHRIQICPPRLPEGPDLSVSPRTNDREVFEGTRQDGRDGSQTTLNPTSTPVQNTSATKMARPKALQRVPTSADDVSLSSSRSKRLVSGYRFGGPQSEEMEKGKTRRDSESTVRRLSMVGNKHHQLQTGAGKTEDELQVTDEEGPLNNDQTTITSSRRALSNTSSTDNSLLDNRDDDLTSVASRPSSPPSRGFDGYEDALNGVTDGEADADVKAIQAVGGGSEGFMKGLEGEEGRYEFPTHRLRRRMKGE
jgi:nicotinamide mononucleotide adenylyltransferase